MPDLCSLKTTTSQVAPPIKRADFPQRRLHDGLKTVAWEAERISGVSQLLARSPRAVKH
jgi:hypothetical protein